MSFFKKITSKISKESVVTDSESINSKQTSDPVSVDPKQTSDSVSVDPKQTSDSVSVDPKQTSDSVSVDPKQTSDPVSVDPKQTSEAFQSDDDWLDKMIKEEEEENPVSWVDESDYLIMSLGASMLLFSALLLSEKFNIPESLFLGAAVFSIYFLLVTSIRKKSKFKFFAIACTFPVTINLTMFILQSGMDISRINNALSLAAIGFSLVYLPKQKIYDRSQLERSKLKNHVLKDNSIIIKRQLEVINKLKKDIENMRKDFLEINSLKEEFYKIENELIKSSKGVSDKEIDSNDN